MHPDAITAAEARMQALHEAGHAIAARYDREDGRVVVDLHTGMQLAFPADLAEGLAGASADDLAIIEISAAGLGLHWPKLDADLYVPALLQGVFGSKQWDDDLANPSADDFAAMALATAGAGAVGVNEAGQLVRVRADGSEEVISEA